MPSISFVMISIISWFNVGQMGVTTCRFGYHVMTHSLVFLPYEPKHSSFPSMGLYIVKRPLLSVICEVFDSPPGHSVLAGRLWWWRVPPLFRESLHRPGVTLLSISEFDDRLYDYSPHIFLCLTTATLDQVFCWVIYSGPLSVATMVMTEGGGIVTLEKDVCVIAWEGCEGVILTLTKL